MNQPIPIAQAVLPALLGNNTIGELAAVARDPNHPKRQIVECQCSECGAPLQAMAFFSQVTACDDCRTKYEREEKLNSFRDYWESICPPSLRATDRTHRDFPKAQFDLLKDWNFSKQSLFFFGPTDKGKTRLAVVLLRRALLRDKKPGILWPEDFKALKFSREPDKAVKKWGSYDVLLLDDALMAAAGNEMLCDILKDIIDYRQRYERPTIITSQIDGTDMKESTEKYKNSTSTETERIEAIMRRIRKSFQIVAFAGATPNQPASLFQDDRPF